MAKIIRLSESDLTKIVKRILMEDETNLTPDETSETNVDDSDIESHVQNETIPQEVNNSAVKQVFFNEVIKPADNFCRKNDNQGLIQFLKQKLREYRNKRKETRAQRRADRKGKTQMSEQGNFYLQSAAALAGFALLVIIIIKLANRDGCRKYARWRDRNFNGYR